MTEREIFLSALEIEDRAARQSHVRTACAGDPALLARVESLLARNDNQFLETPLAKQMAIGPDADSAPTVMYEYGSKEHQEVHTEFWTGGGKSMSEKRDGESYEILLGYLQPCDKPGSLGRLAHYVVLQVLGRGAFGIVLKAMDEKLERVVAIKVLAPEMAATSPARQRFLREARASAAIRHEHVVSIHAVDETPLPYLVMDYIPGQTLQQRLDERGPLDVPTTVRLGKQIAEGLAAAHEQDLIHRDIKPGNILLEGGTTERVKITDFGLARAADDASMTQSGLIAGTPMYMAPEQALGEKIDERADLFSLGTVLYQMVSGHPPFRAGSTVAVLKRVVDDEPRAIREVIPETPQWLCDIIAKLHAKDPDDRYQSAREVAAVLADCEAQLKANTRLEDFSRIPRIKSADSGRSKWLVATAAVLLPIVALVATELAGVTHLFRSGPPTNDAQQPEPLANAAFDAKSGGKDKASSPAVAPFTDPDRRAAEYVLSIGGFVKVNDQEQEIHANADLPREPFRLTVVDLADNHRVTDAGLAVLKDCRNLKIIALYFDRQVTDAGLAHFKDCKTITQLHLQNTAVTDAGLAYFKDCKNITDLYLGGPQITDTGLACFKDCKALGLLCLSNTRVSNAGLAHLKGMSLRSLWIQDTGITDLTPLQGIPLEYIILTPKNITKGLEILRDVKSYKNIGLSWEKSLPAAEFWDRYDRGEFTK
jgi:serine/threonine protein kinase